MVTGALILVLAAGAAAGVATRRARTDGRFLPGTSGSPEPGPRDRRPTTPGIARHLAAVLPDAGLGERATLVQFSSAFCAPCRTTRVVLGDVAAGVDGVVHLEVDAESELDLVRSLDVRRTPTTLILDADGRELARAVGAPRREQVLAALPVETA